MTFTEPRPTTTILGDDLLERCRERAAAHDRDNTFFAEDFAELVAAGYLTAAVPMELGGWDLSLAELAAEHRRLARHAPATALATAMHHYWVGLAADLRRFGDPSLTWILEDVMAGHVFAAGHAEAGNDISVALSTATAVPVEGGYRLTGHKHFGSLSPVWTRFGAHALDASDPDNPVIVHAFVDRDAPGLSIVDTWDTLGMRSSQSQDTVLDEVFVPAARIGAVLPAGTSDAPFAGVMSIWALTLIGNVYLGIAERAFELAVASASERTAIAIPGRTYSRHPFVQHQISEMYLALHAATATVDNLARDWSAGVDHGDTWAQQLLASKWHAVDAAQRVVGRAMDVVGGSSFFRRHELERLYRDVRAGSFHPGTDAFTHEAIAKQVLGIGPDEPRW